jgi:hypothetical protein
MGERGMKRNSADFWRIAEPGFVGEDMEVAVVDWVEKMAEYEVVLVELKLPQQNSPMG